MRPLHIMLGAALALLSTSASAEAWERSGERLSLPRAGLSFPLQAGTLALTETREASLGGEGVDNVAQYKSGDGGVFATLFVYMPAYADAALAGYELEKIIGERYGGRRASSKLVPAAGVPNGALRRVYVDAEGGKLVTSAALIKAGRWLAVVRVSGPAARQAEVESALDAMVGGFAASASSPVDPVAELQVSDCPAPSKKAAKRKQMRLEGAGLDNNPIARMLIDATLAGGITDKDKPPFPPSIADNGRRPVCIRERVKVGANVIDMMQPAGDTSKPQAIIGLVNDAGRTIEMRRGEMGDLYLLRVHDVARTASFGAFDRPLDPSQIGVILTADPQAAGMLSQTTYKADGTFSTEVFVRMGK
jgi:hypothetical protein